MEDPIGYFKRKNHELERWKLEQADIIFDGMTRKEKAKRLGMSFNRYQYLRQKHGMIKGAKK